MHEFVRCSVVDSSQMTWTRLIMGLSSQLGSQLIKINKTRRVVCYLKALCWTNGIHALMQ